MKLMAVAVLMAAVLMAANGAYSATYTTAANGTTLTLDISPQALKKPSGATEIKVDGTWSYSKGNASLTNGTFYPSYWTDYKNGTSALFENNITKGALIAFLFAPPSASCSAGAMIQAILEMTNAVSSTNAGSPVTLTPVSGFICGDTINSFTSYSLALATTANISGATTTVTTTSTTTTVVSSENPASFGWLGTGRVTFTATVSPSSATGTVTFKDGSKVLGTGTLSLEKVTVIGASGVSRMVATYSTWSLTSWHSITAEYGGDTNHATSTSSALIQTVISR